MSGEDEALFCTLSFSLLANGGELLSPLDATTYLLVVVLAVMHLWVLRFHLVELGALFRPIALRRCTMPRRVGALLGGELHARYYFDLTGYATFASIALHDCAQEAVPRLSLLLSQSLSWRPQSVVSLPYGLVTFVPCPMHALGDRTY